MLSRGSFWEVDTTHLRSQARVERRQFQHCQQTASKHFKTAPNFLGKTFLCAFNEARNREEKKYFAFVKRKFLENKIFTASERLTASISSRFTNKGDEAATCQRRSVCQIRDERFNHRWKETSNDSRARQRLRFFRSSSIAASTPTHSFRSTAKIVWYAHT